MNNFISQMLKLGAELEKTDDLVHAGMIVNDAEILYRDETKKLTTPVRTPSVIKKGFAQAMDGNTLLVNTKNDELIQINIKDTTTRLALYCEYIKITIEVIDKTELD